MQGWCYARAGPVRNTTLAGYLYARHLTYLTIPTVYFSNLPQPRTKTLFGCNKTLAILKYFLAKYPEQAWLVLVDDDTILSVTKLRTMLACYRDIEEPIILGFSVILPI